MAFRSVPLRRAPIKRKQLPERPTVRHPRPSGPDEDTVIRVLRRALRDGEICCEVCGDAVYGTRALHWSIHHRRGRDGRPDANFVANLLLCCGSDNQSGCHGRIHQRRSESQPAGWWISRIAAKGGIVPDPLTIPVLIDHESRWVYFTADGSYADDPPEVIP